MNDAIFRTYFRFNEVCYSETTHMDNSRGIDIHHICFMKHGRGRIVAQKQVLEIEENEMLYIPKGCSYHSYWIAEDNVRFDSIGFLYFPNATPNGYKLQKINYDATLMEAFLPLSKQKELNTTSIGTLYHLLGLLEPRLELEPHNKDIAICEKLTLLMNQNPQRTIPEYATLCEVSETLLYNYVKRIFHKTPNRLRQEILCEKAAQLLFTTTHTIEDICDKVGFSSAAYFRKVFESVYQKTPSQFRKDAKKYNL